MRILAVAMVAVMLAIAGLTYDLFTQYTLAKTASRSFGFADYSASVSARLGVAAPVSQAPAEVASLAAPTDLAKKSGAVSAFLAMFKGRGQSSDTPATDAGSPKGYATAGGAKPMVVNRSGGCGGTVFCKVGGD